MAAAEDASKSLKCKTWVLKVFIHCEGCRREVKKALHGIDGVYTTTVESQLHKVTVVGNVDSETLIKKLSKAGKHAVIWSENSPTKANDKGSEKQSETKNSTPKKKENAAGGQQSGKKAKKNDSQGNKPAGAAQPKKEVTSSLPDKMKGKDSPIPGEKQQAAVGGGKKNKNKGGQKVEFKENENTTSKRNGASAPNQAGGGGGIHGGVGFDLNSPHLQQQPPFSNQFYSPNQAPQSAAPVYVMSYSTGPSTYGKDHAFSYQIPASASPFVYVGTQHQQQETNAPLAAAARFDMFSEDNPSGCSIM